MNTQAKPDFDHGNYLMSGVVIAALVIIFVSMLAQRPNATIWAAAYFPLIALHVWLLMKTTRLRLDGDSLSVSGLRAANNWSVLLPEIRSATLVPPGLRRAAAWQLRIVTAEGEKQAYLARMSPLFLRQLQDLLAQRLGDRYKPYTS
ncbi:hypothetical protein [Massilia endophytica]|uniref:hypothetical protein n=1 Tax=Massilia endophytica TaxID=2899220 RepID=UPI001E2A7385|nr:hypothetical protein [Massilia endophytica]UGQ47049.1 hypothetical protein LSQ66_00810 [Massilia endophytica]